MQRSKDDFPIEVRTPYLNPLDHALNKLGMLATGTSSRKDYLKEKNRQRVVNLFSINPKYVSTVSIGIRPLAPHVRYKPYTIKERHRTRSENNDSDMETSLNQKSASSTLPHYQDPEIVRQSEEITQLKKAKSLESIVAESGATNIDLKNIVIGNCPEMEYVSNSIQNLRVAE